MSNLQLAMYSSCLIRNYAWTNWKLSKTKLPNYSMQQRPDGALRLAVVGGGCSGLQYVMDLVDGPKERDILVPISKVRLVVDPKSALFVSGSVLDYSEDLQKGGFKVTNPNAVAHCSCGESFAV